MSSRNPLPPRGHAASTTGRQAYLDTRERFDRQAVARKYAGRKNVATARNRREWKCIERALRGLPPGAAVLDLPCGTGRLERLLQEAGYRVTGADYSEHMLEVAEQAYLQEAGLEELPAGIRFVQQDVMATDFADGTFDAVVCNRLLHHYPAPEVRRDVLRELARVSRGLVVISYFSNAAFSAFRFHLKSRLLRREPTDRIPIWYRELQRDIAAAGLRRTGTYPVRFGLSPQTYLRLEK